MSINFTALWNAHPQVNGDDSPCRRKDGHKAFDDQCAIRVGTALARCGYDVTKLQVQFCWPFRRSYWFMEWWQTDYKIKLFQASVGVKHWRKFQQLFWCKRNLVLEDNMKKIIIIVFTLAGALCGAALMYLLLPFVSRYWVGSIQGEDQMSQNFAIYCIGSVLLSLSGAVMGWVCSKKLNSFYNQDWHL